MKRILIVDDQPHIIRILNDTVKKTGSETEIANNGKVGVDKALEFKPDLIFMDIMMPVMTGFEATKEIRQIPEFKDVPVVFLTAKGQQADKKKAQELGSDHFITKPFSPRAIVTLVEEILGG